MTFDISHSCLANHPFCYSFQWLLTSPTAVPLIVHFVTVSSDCWHLPHTAVPLIIHFVTVSSDCWHLPQLSRHAVQGGHAQRSVDCHHGNQEETQQQGVVAQLQGGVSHVIHDWRRRSRALREHLHYWDHLQRCRVELLHITLQTRKGNTYYFITTLISLITDVEISYSNMYDLVSQNGNRIQHIFIQCAVGIAVVDLKNIMRRGGVGGRGDVWGVWCGGENMWPKRTPTFSNVGKVW